MNAPDARSFNDEHVEQARPLLQHPAELRLGLPALSSEQELDSTAHPPPPTAPHYRYTPGFPPAAPDPVSPATTPTLSEPDLGGPGGVFGPPAVAPSYGPPVIVEGPYRRVPDFPPPVDSYQQPAWEASLNAAMLTDFRDELARLDGVITPGVDNTPFIHYAVEALTRDRDTGYSTAAPSGTSSLGPVFGSGQQQQPQQYQQHPPRSYQSEPAQQRPPVAVPAPAHPPAAHPPAETALPDPPLQQPLRPFIPGPRESAQSLADTLLKKGSRPPQPHEWRPVETDELLARAPELPPLSFRPWPLRPPALFGFMALCVLLIAALILSAVYSQLHHGLLAWATLYGGRYFLFRIFPSLIGAVVLLYAQYIAKTMFRILPFVRLASSVPEEREGALFQELYPSFLWPHLVGPWNVWVPTLVTWLMNFTIPLQSSVFTVILVDQTWTWATVQGVAWTLVALYLALLVSTVIVWRYWATLESTGLIWDPRSLADIAALVSETNTAGDYRMTQLARTRDGIRFALRRRVGDRLCYWTWKDGRHGFWHTLGSPMDEANLIPIPDLASGQPMQRHDEKQTGGLFGTDPDENHDIEASRTSTPARHRYLPWCLRSSQLLWFTVTAFILLLAIFIVSFLPSTRIAKGFPPDLKADPQPGAFSSADFLYSFLPSLLGTLVFLAFQPLDTHLRVLQPWAALSQPRGAPAHRSILADYAACAPIQCTLHALRNRHWRVAVLSLLSTLFVLIPVLAGGAFMALTNTSSSSESTQSYGEVLIYPNTPAYAILLALLLLYLGALASLLPARANLRMPHAVTCLAEIVGYLVAADLRDEPAFKRCVSRDEMVGKMGLAGAGGGRAQGESWWVFSGGSGPGNVGGEAAATGGAGEELAVRRVKRFTEKRRVRKSQIRRVALL
ncbi:faf0e8c0-7990-44c0-bda0-f5961e5a6597 [Thermothielavioides terrestris]|uniref:Phosphoribosylaminoimidazole-succinocarboxamide synthase n=2 Tax=Thermothielavioides terrestris TaxID=2587410 RepID=G2R500_THETT|nr:uncharacterized protein THITE_2112125 [Thermothielavioides terrestris NRRL 8126]AEO65277.1 hypothetical protein THITE_2112125 [Thermothielavioides terrestris NRRL 8126]SPQ19479.1 faf0e8c0-7990-44c0-bda0-f5961e5a6597 [Thermothielavioides terrestris]